MSEKTIGELLTDLRAVVDERETLSTRDGELSKLKAEIEYALQCKAKEQGVPGFKSDAGSITFVDDLRAKYDPERWDAIVEWAVSSGNHFIFQRRLTDVKVKALVVEGVALPDGLSLESYTKTSFRR